MVIDISTLVFGGVDMIDLYVSIHDMLSGDEAYIPPEGKILDSISKATKNNITKTIGRRAFTRLEQFIFENSKDEDFSQVVSQVYFNNAISQVLRPEVRTPEEHMISAAKTAVELHRILTACDYDIDKIIGNYFSHKV